MDHETLGRFGNGSLVVTRAARVEDETDAIAGRSAPRGRFEMPSPSSERCSTTWSPLGNSIERLHNPTGYDDLFESDE